MSPLRASVCSLCVILLLVGACNNPAPTSPTGLAVVSLRIGHVDYTLEVADTVTSRATGLMRRDSMPDQHGMIFVFPDEDLRRFHMQNTRIPLDILFLDARGRVVSVSTMKPYDLSTTPSAAPARYAIELNAGQALRNGVKVGDVLDIPVGARTSKE